jgi:hypothetical protein
MARRYLDVYGELLARRPFGKPVPAPDAFMLNATAAREHLAATA